MLTFPSAYARERFAARFRAIKLDLVDITGESKNGNAVLSTGEMLRFFCGTFNVGDKAPPSKGSRGTMCSSIFAMSQLVF